MYANSQSLVRASGNLWLQSAIDVGVHQLSFFCDFSAEQVQKIALLLYQNSH